MQEVESLVSYTLVLLASQEVLGSLSAHSHFLRVGFASPWRRVKLNEFRMHVFVDLHDRGLVPASVAVVGRAEQSDYRVLVRPVVSLHDQLMCSDNKLEAVDVVEMLRNILSEGVSCSSRADSPSNPVVRVAPHQIADGTFMGNFLESLELLHLRHCIKGGRQPSVGTKQLLVDGCREREEIKQIREAFPHIRAAIFSDAFIVKSIHLSDLP
mmetsp:Transcript_28058/g.63438  ORF Transcript_28058/g.63438 Transcript_28058/m.63438 type:complete len:212 (+) Transcript_28058:167-802(+)